MNLRAPIDTKAEGTVIEARVDKGMGVVVTALVQKGSLKIGDYVLAGPSWGKVRRLVSDQRVDLKEAGPSTPVRLVLLHACHHRFVSSKKSVENHVADTYHLDLLTITDCWSEHSTQCR